MRKNLITINDLYEINKKLVTMFGGAGVGFKDENLAISAIEGCNQEVFGLELYPELEDKIAHLVFSITKNHIFLDGNKRTSAFVLNMLCKKNNIKLNIELDRVILDLSTDIIKEKDLAKLIKSFRNLD